MKPEMTFCFGADEHYFPGLVIAVLSTIQSLAPTKQYHFIFLDGGIEDASFAKLELHVLRLVKQRSHSLTFERIQLELGTFADLPKIWGRSAMTYARLLLPDLIVADSVVWVDSDMLVFQDLSEFGARDASSTLIAGVTDPIVKNMDGDCPLPPEDRKCTDTTYVNCGLLWMNLKLMRETSFKANIFTFMAKHKDKLQYWDQTALNASTMGRKETLPERYNLFCLLISNEDLATKVVHNNLHMVSSNKPWLPERSRDQITRDLTFWKTWELLTGEDSTSRIREVVSQVTLKEYMKSVWKRYFYAVFGTLYRKDKWKRIHAEYHSVRRGQIQRNLDSALSAWARA